MFNRDRKPEDVFTPRSPQINADMYVDRSDLELRLIDLVGGGKNIVIHGDSGNGKTWLYKKVLNSSKVEFEIINLANVGRYGGVLGCIRQKAQELLKETHETVQSTVSHEGSVGVPLVGFKGAQQQQIKPLDRDYLSEVMAFLSRRSKSEKNLLVFDNFEAIAGDSNQVNELAQLIILLDDEKLSSYNCRLLIVGVPSGIKEYLQRVGNLQTISNRISELPEVARLSKDEARALLKRGLEDLLLLKVEDESIYARMLYSTDRIAQYLHDLGLEVARIARRDDCVVSLDVVKRAERIWLQDTVSAAAQVIRDNMNSFETKAGRRNQVIYSIGLLDLEEFRHTEIEDVIKREFPISAGGSLNLWQILSDLSKRSNPLIRRSPKGVFYRVIDPRMKIAIRLMLDKVDEKVVSRFDIS